VEQHAVFPPHVSSAMLPRAPCHLLSVECAQAPVALCVLSCDGCWFLCHNCPPLRSPGFSLSCSCAVRCPPPAWALPCWLWCHDHHPPLRCHRPPLPAPPPLPPPPAPPHPTPVPDVRAGNMRVPGGSVWRPLGVNAEEGRGGEGRGAPDSGTRGVLDRTDSYVFTGLTVFAFVRYRAAPRRSLIA